MLDVTERPHVVELALGGLSSSVVVQPPGIIQVHKLGQLLI